MTYNIEGLTRYRGMELAQATSEGQPYGFAPEHEPGKIVGTIKAMASYVRDAYWRAKGYGLGNPDTLGIIDRNFGVLKEWDRASKLFNHLNKHYRTEASGDYGRFRKYTAALMGLFNYKAYQLEAA